jgi:hypothetical protein
MQDIFYTLVQLVETLYTLVVQTGLLALRHALLLVWVAWWLWGVNWGKAWGVLARGGWMVVVLLTVVTALVWASIAPGTFDVLGLFTLANFWWQLAAVTLIVLLALFCGWVQGRMGWQPAEIDLEPPAPAVHHDHHGHH